MKTILQNQIADPLSQSETGVSAKTGRMLLRTLRAAQPVSRIELARRLGINRSTVTDTFKPLIAAGMIREHALLTASKTNRLQGRPPVGLSFNSDNDFFVGVNLGVRHTQIGLTILTGEMLAETEFETPVEPGAALKLIQRNVAELCEKNKGRRLRSVGVSVPGPTDAARSRLLYAPHLGWHDVAVAEELRKKCGIVENIPIIVENDATAAAMYEVRLHLRNADNASLKNFVLLRSGTGIGVGLVIEGEVYRGTGLSEGSAGEFGHMTIVAGGKQCVCGNRGCWEKYASASAASSLYTGDRANLGGASPPRFLDIVGRAESGEIRAQRTLEKLGEYLGIGIANVIIGLGVPRIIVSGRLVYGWKFIKDPLREAVGKSMVGKLAGWTVECGEAKGAAIGGALEVAVEEFLIHGLTSVTTKI
jgi:predicted NBD/HSP70 family sugar kinase